MSEKVVWQLLQQYAAGVGLPGIAPHDLRRYAEWLIMPNPCIGGVNGWLFVARHAA
jgi:hypothetical protein